LNRHLFLQPLDVLYLRGNKLFGDPGSFGESLIPPWPSVAAGALRSQILAQDGIDLSEFAAGRIEHAALGTPERPGPFTVTSFHLARRAKDGTVSSLYAPPADLVIRKDDDGALGVSALRPTRPADGIQSSSALTLLPVLAEDARGKPVGGYWLTEAGWRKYLAGGVPTADDLIESAMLWKLDTRVGVGLDASTGRADDGKLFTVQAAAFDSDVGFLVSMTGAEPPTSGAIRIGGDGRGAIVHETSYAAPLPDFEAIAESRRCRILLTTPGLFPNGWKLPGIDEEERFRLGEIGGRLVCAAVTRAEVVSGWDLAKQHPKPAARAVPTGSVYWLDDLDATPDQLRKLAAAGLWRDAAENAARRAEGFNRFIFAAY